MGISKQNIISLISSRYGFTFEEFTVNNTPVFGRPSLRNYIAFIETENNCYQVINRVPTPSGYIIVSIKNKQTYLHRISCLLFHGNSNLHACHSCDNPACFNPNHLFLGSDQDNVDDMIRKGRNTVGEKNHSSILLEKQAVEIFNSNENNTDLSKRYGVHWVTIYDIKQKRTWRHIHK